MFDRWIRALRTGWYLSSISAVGTYVEVKRTHISSYYLESIKSDSIIKSQEFKIIRVLYGEEN